MQALQNIFQAQIIQNLGWVLVHFVWQAAAVAFILAVTLKLLQKHSANLRYLLACIALTFIVILPVITIRMVGLSVASIDSDQSTSITLPKTDTDSQAAIELPLTENPPLPIPPAPQISLKDRFIEVVEPALPFIALGWLFGVFGLSLWHLGGWTQIQRLRRQMVKPVPYTLKAKLQSFADILGITKSISLMESALVQVPTVVGHLKPVILLPASALTGLTPQQLQSILAHELAHIKRHDYLFNILQTVVEILGFYHPAVWWISRKIRVERENCSDDLALSLCPDKLSYAHALTAMEEIRPDRAVLAVAASGGSLIDRIRRLLAKDSTRDVKPSWLPSALAIFLIASILIPVCFALSSQPTGDIEKQNGVKTVILSIFDEGSLEKVDSIVFSVFDFSKEKKTEVTLPLKGLSEREKLSHFFNTTFNLKADLFIRPDGGIMVRGPSTSEFKRMSLKDISKFGAKALAAHIRAVERNRPSDLIDLTALWNDWLSPGEVGAFLTKDDLVVAVQAGKFIPRSKQGEFKYIIVGRLDPRNLPDPKLLKEVVIRNKIIAVAEHPEFIENLAKKLFEKIQTADYDYFLKSKDTDLWGKFPIVESYNTYKEYPKLVNWICKTFNDNPIVSVKLDKVNTDGNSWPTVEYALTLKDGSTIEGVLRFEYHFYDEFNGRWYGIHGLDWHLQKNPIKKSTRQNEAREKISRLLKADLPDSASNVRFHYWGFGTISKTLIRFDIPLPDLKLFLSSSDRLPIFSQLKDDQKIRERMDNQFNFSDIDWWKPKELKFTLLGYWEEGHPAAENEKVWIHSELQLCCSEIEKDLMRVYIGFCVIDSVMHGNIQKKPLPQTGPVQSENRTDRSDTEQANILHGIVRDQSGNPVVGALVLPLPYGGYPVETGPNGKFSLPGPSLEPERFIDTLLVRDINNNLALAVPVIDPNKPFDITLMPGLTLTGRVTDPYGRPLPEVRLYPSVYASDNRDWHAGFGLTYFQLTDDKGCFEIKALPTGLDCGLAVGKVAGYNGKTLRLGVLNRPADGTGRKNLGDLILESALQSGSKSVPDDR